MFELSGLATMIIKGNSSNLFHSPTSITHDQTVEIKFFKKAADKTFATKIKGHFIQGDC